MAFGSKLTALNLSAPEYRSSPLENPTVGLASPGIWSWLMDSNPTAAGEIVNDKTALQITTVYACVRLLSESVASLPLKLYERSVRGRTEAVDNPLYDLLATSPNIEMTAFTFWETFIGAMALTGNGYAQLERAKNNSVIGIWPLDPRKTEPVRLPDGSLAYRTSDGMQNGQHRIIASADVLHCPLFGYDGLKGLSPIAQARQSLGLAIAAEKFGGNYFGNGGQPRALLMPDFKPDEKTANQLKESFNSSNGGTNKMGITVLPNTWKYQQLSITPEEAQFLATREFQRTEIAALFRVPSHYVGDTARLSNTNHEQSSLSLVTDTLRPYLARIESEIGRKLLPKLGRKAGAYYVAFDVTERLRGDFQTTMKGYQTGVLSGWLSRNDVRKELGENPGPAELDIYMVPVNMQAAIRLTDTESLQDQPIATDPEATPTPTERTALTGYRTAYLRLFRDAVGRVCKRDKRDLTAITQAFQPLFESLADLSADSTRSSMKVDGWDHDAEKLISEMLQKLVERSTKWQADKADEIAGAELTRAFRALTYQLHRDAGEHLAVKALEEINEN